METSKHKPDTSFFVKHKKEILIGSGVFIALSLGGIAYYYHHKKKEEENVNLAPSKSNKKPVFQCISTKYPLRFGTCHKDVGIVQHYLKTIHKAELGTSGKNKDGIDKQFGPKTKGASLQLMKKAVFHPKDIEAMKVALKFV